MNNYFAPTVNEIKFHREDRQRNHNPFVSQKRAKFKVNDMVRFSFNGLSKVGRITTAICIAGAFFYHVETATHQWFQKINENDITSESK